MPVTTTAAKPAATKRFQLPALDFKFGSLTEGTDIPPPLPSPVQEVPTPPQTPPVDVDGEKKKESNGAANSLGDGTKTWAHSDAVHTTTITGGIKRSAEDVPSSPTLSSRGSFRHLISKNLLHNTHTHDDHSSIASRPPSRTASVMADERKSKRTSSWFRRLRSSNHSASAIEHAVVSPLAPPSAPPLYEEPQKPAGPPPPMIPELSALEAKIDTSMGDDLFKEIK